MIFFSRDGFPSISPLEKVLWRDWCDILTIDNDEHEINAEGLIYSRDWENDNDDDDEKVLSIRR